MKARAGMPAIRVDASRCSGCRYCEMWCSYKHEGVFSSSLSRVTVVRDVRIGLDYPVICRFCEPAPCMEACPTGSIRRNDIGAIVIFEETCSSCGNCINSCPYGAIKMHKTKGVPIVCDLCGGEPECVKRCPMNALTFQRFEVRALEITDPAYIYALREFAEQARRWGLDVE
ncbi:4Fe-4S dicluster domain-containing protein [Candidatus Korarchaeum cryptofilum]|uniref:4Fe-4S dicluster domain-containing protein n=2 Tax=Candidatus Korarchaeum cryptofilum TaxID=498846 RepID=A0A3R9WZR1_9CREN|nr:4Fe-4S dicluster domain-containing protein [Candidatus Korarchaeum cryptofilum]